MKLNALASALGLLGLVAQTSALPRVPAEFRPVAPREDAAAAIRVMPFGASIVQITCWRAFLWKKLRDSGITNMDFVGSQNGPGTCTLNGQAVDFDKDNEGHSGALATQYAANGNLTGWLSNAKPDMILMHLGTNDVTAKISTADIMKAYDTLYQQMKKQNSKTTIIISNLVPLDPDRFGKDIAANLNTVNKAIADFVKARGLIFVDNNTGFDVKNMTDDGEHPNEKGSVFMADRFFKSVENELKSGGY